LKGIRIRPTDDPESHEGLGIKNISTAIDIYIDDKLFYYGQNLYSLKKKLIKYWTKKFQLFEKLNVKIINDGEYCKAYNKYLKDDWKIYLRL